MNKAEKLYQEGNRAFNNGALLKAAELFHEVTEIVPENYKAWGNLGACHAYLGEKKKAVECYEKALSLEPGYEFAKTNLKTIKNTPEERLGSLGIIERTRPRKNPPPDA